MTTVSRFPQSSRLCDTRTLVCFYLVATLGSYRQAAQCLSITVPALSAPLRQLESELGVVLFVRGGRRQTELTEAGAVLLTHVESVFRQLDDLCIAVQADRPFR
ncbi:LysR family transcriptional regulator [Alcaligenaceae bacterium]|nr:LysR family transcriptional regulator [Alcaligenaceae bacterium]